MNSSEEFARQMIQIIEQLFFVEKNNVFFYDKELKLYPSEIHLILLIDDGHSTNSTEMANKLRVTKGAVSQTISRLEKKNIIEKTKDPYKKNELTVLFTPLGKKVLEDCRKILSLYHDKFASYFLSLQENDQEVINRFLSFLKDLSNIKKINS